MTAGLYRIIVTGRIGPTLSRAFSDLVPEVVGRHHVLLVPDDVENRLLSVLDRLDDRGIEVDEVIARYR
jgi:hypothetical protein